MAHTHLGLRRRVGSSRRGSLLGSQAKAGVWHACNHLHGKGDLAVYKGLCGEQVWMVSEEAGHEIDGTPSVFPIDEVAAWPRPAKVTCKRCLAVIQSS